jgi:hypothetical protein
VAIWKTKEDAGGYIKPDPREMSSDDEKLSNSIVYQDSSLGPETGNPKALRGCPRQMTRWDLQAYTASLCHPRNNYA